MAKALPPLLKNLRPGNILLPTLIGLLAVAYVFISRFDKEAFYSLRWDKMAVLWISLAFATILIRDLGYVLRLRLITNNKIPFTRCIYIILMWEFASSASPSSIGGTALGLFMIRNEGFSTGQSSAFVLLSIFFDELFFITTVPLFLLIYGKTAIIPQTINELGATEQIELNSLLFLFTIAYVILLVYTLIIFYGLFINPEAVKRLLFYTCSWKPLRKFRRKALQIGVDLSYTSKEIRKKSFLFFLKGYSATLLSWSGRFMVANLILMAMSNNLDHLLLFSRQIVMFICMTISPTPGASGVAEISFANFLIEYVPQGMEATLALLWRMITFYPHLIVGALLLPGLVDRLINKSEN